MTSFERVCWIVVFLVWVASVEFRLWVNIHELRVHAGNPCHLEHERGVNRG